MITSIKMLFKCQTELELLYKLFLAVCHSTGLLPLPAESKDRVFLGLDHALESASDLVLDGIGSWMTTLRMADLLAVSEDLPAGEAHLWVEL